MNFEFPKSAIKNGPAAAMYAAHGEKEGWQLVAPGLAWIEFKDPVESLYLVPSQRGKGRKYAVITWELGQRLSASVYLVNSISKLEKSFGKASQVITGQELAELLEPAKTTKKPAAKKEAEKPAEKAAKKTSQASEKKPAKKAAQKPVKDTGFTVVTLDRKELHIKPAKAVKEKVIKETTQKPAGLQFGPALVANKEGKVTIASLLHAGKVFASRAVPAEFSARFKKYSTDNQLLLYLQGGPALGPVSTYRGWIKQGRQVSKGQHGLKILAPRMVEKEDGTKAIDGLRLVTLFSIDQTEEAKKRSII